MRCWQAMATVAALFAAAGSARAEVTSYRVTEVKPSAKGATLHVSYKNEWGSPAENERHGSLTLYAYVDGKPRTVTSKDYKTGNYHHSGAITVGTFSWVGTGQTKIQLDYEQLGLKPGTKLLTQANFFWGDHGHNWGDTEGGKPAGGPFVLPEPKPARRSAASKTTAATKNSWLAGWRGGAAHPLGATRRPSWAAPRRGSSPWPSAPLRQRAFGR